MVEKAGAGPPGCALLLASHRSTAICLTSPSLCHSLPGKTLTTEKLVEALRFVCTPESAEAARAMGEKIQQEVRRQ